MVKKKKRGGCNSCKKNKKRGGAALDWSKIPGVKKIDNSCRCIKAPCHCNFKRGGNALGWIGANILHPVNRSIGKFLHKNKKARGVRDFAVGLANALPKLPRASGKRRGGTRFASKEAADAFYKKYGSYHHFPTSIKSTKRR